MTSPIDDARVSKGSGLKESEQGYAALSYILAGILLYGGLGWLGDRLCGTHWMLPVGFLGGSILSLYLVVKRFGGATSPSADNADEARASRGEESE